MSSASLITMIYCLLGIFLTQLTSASVQVQHTLFKTCMMSKGIPASAIVERMPNSEAYAKLNYQFNTRIKVFPWAYFLPTSTQDVQKAVKCARKLNIPLIPKSGGHSAESFSFGNSSTVIIDFKRMKAVEVNSALGTAKIGPGAQLGSVYGKLWEKGFGLPMGIYWKVGIGGYALGGGFGIFAGKYGLTADHVVELTMVDAAGRARKVNERRNPDLFWALRGVGSGYIGIVTSFEFKLFRATGLRSSLVTFSYSSEHTAEVLEAWQNWLTWKRDNEPSIWSHLSMAGSMGNEGIEVKIVYVTDESSYSPEDFHEAIPKIFPTYSNYKESSQNFIQLILDTANLITSENISWRDVGLVNSEGIQESQYYLKPKCFFVSKKGSPCELRNLANFIKGIPKTGPTVKISSFGGAVNEVPPTATAFVHRTSMYLVECTCSGSSCANEGDRWCREFVDRAKFLDNGESYQNYVDLEWGDTYLRRYYGKNVPRLLDVKKRWDPKNFFQNPESIPVIY